MYRTTAPSTMLVITPDLAPAWPTAAPVELPPTGTIVLDEGSTYEVESMYENEVVDDDAREEEEDVLDEENGTVIVVV